jgi:hypothetical protein
MPSKSSWGPLRYIKDLEKNKEGYSFWNKFYELANLHEEDPEYWKEFSEKMEHTKDYLYDAETLINEELSKTKKKGKFNINIRADFPLSKRSSY